MRKQIGYTAIRTLLPLFRVTPTEEGGRQPVRYSSFTIDLFLLWVIERKDMIHGHGGPQVQPSFRL